MFKKYILFLLLFFSLQEKSLAQSDAVFADRYYKAAQYDRALILYKGLYDKSKGRQYYKQTFDCYFALKDWKNAKKLIAKQKKKTPNNALLYLDEYLLLNQIGENDKAQQKIDKTVELATKNYRYTYSVGRKLDELSLSKATIDLYSTALKNKYNRHFLFQLAKAYQKEGMHQEMVNTYLEVLDKDVKSISRMKVQLQKSIDDSNNGYTLLKQALLKRLKANPKLVYQDMLIWSFLQKKEFKKAYRQEKSLDKRLSLNGKRLLGFAQICSSNKQYSLAKEVTDDLLKNKEISKDYSKEVEEQNILFSVKEYDLDSLKTEENLAFLESKFVHYFDNNPKNNKNIHIQKEYASLLSVYKQDLDRAIQVLDTAIAFDRYGKLGAESKLQLANLLLENNNIWDALLYYNQVEKDFEHDLIGHEARFRKAKVSFYQSDFQWALDQLKVLKTSTSKLIANDALNLSLLIQESLNLDSTNFALMLYARADLTFYQKRYKKSDEILQSLQEQTKTDFLVDDALLLQSKIAHKTKNYKKEQVLLNKILALPESILKDNALFLLAKLHQNELNDQQTALTYSIKLLKEYPTSYWASQARLNIKKIRNKNENNI